MYIVVAGKDLHHLGNHCFDSHKPHNNCPSLPHLQNKIMMFLLLGPFKPCSNTPWQTHNFLLNPVKSKPCKSIHNQMKCYFFP